MSGYTRIKDMVWPCPGGEMAALEWSLRYGNPDKGQLCYAASIVAAYTQMIYDKRDKRQMVIAALRKDMKGQE